MKMSVSEAGGGGGGGGASGDQADQEGLLSPDAPAAAASTVVVASAPVSTSSSSTSAFNISTSLQPPSAAGFSQLREDSDDEDMDGGADETRRSSAGKGSKLSTYLTRKLSKMGKHRPDGSSSPSPARSVTADPTPALTAAAAAERGDCAEIQQNGESAHSTLKEYKSRHCRSKCKVAEQVNYFRLRVWGYMGVLLSFVKYF